LLSPARTAGVHSATCMVLLLTACAGHNRLQQCVLCCMPSQPHTPSRQGKSADTSCCTHVHTFAGDAPRTHAHLHVGRPVARQGPFHHHGYQDGTTSEPYSKHSQRCTDWLPLTQHPLLQLPRNQQPAARNASSDLQMGLINITALQAAVLRRPSSSFSSSAGAAAAKQKA
jgi:hypothetical protein